MLHTNRRPTFAPTGEGARGLHNARYNDGPLIPKTHSSVNWKIISNGTVIDIARRGVRHSAVQRLGSDFILLPKAHAPKNTGHILIPKGARLSCYNRGASRWEETLIPQEDYVLMPRQGAGNLNKRSIDSQMTNNIPQLPRMEATHQQLAPLIQRSTSQLSFPRYFAGTQQTSLPKSFIQLQPEIRQLIMTYEQDPTPQRQQEVKDKIHQLIALDESQRADIQLRYPSGQTMPDAHRRGVEFFRSLTSRSVMVPRVVDVSSYPNGVYSNYTLSSTGNGNKHYTTDTINIGRHFINDPDEEASAVAHELAHALEADTTTLNKNKAYMEKHAFRNSDQSVQIDTNMEIMKGDWITKGGANSGGPTSKGTINIFYSGRIYRDHRGQITATDFLTMGVERLFLDPINFFKQDPEYFGHVIDTLRGSDVSEAQPQVNQDSEKGPSPISPQPISPQPISRQIIIPAGATLDLVIPITGSSCYRKCRKQCNVRHKLIPFNPTDRAPHGSTIIPKGTVIYLHSPGQHSVKYTLESDYSIHIDSSDNHLYRHGYSASGYYNRIGYRQVLRA